MPEVAIHDNNGMESESLPSQSLFLSLGIRREFSPELEVFRFIQNRR